MAGEEIDAVLSDVEDDGDVPVPIDIKTPAAGEEVSAERFREVVAELDRERRSREAAESSKADLETKLNRLKVLAHEAIKKRDEASRQRDELAKSNERLSTELSEASRKREELAKSNERLVSELGEAVRLKEENDKLSENLEEAVRAKEDTARILEDTGKARDTSRSEIEAAAHMLVKGIEKISGKVRNFQSFNGLPRSQKYTGLPAVAYGVIKRTNEIVEELLRQVEMAVKSRNEARVQMEQRNYEIAIEVSQLEATISGLREEVLRKTSVVDGLEKSLAEKDGKIVEMEKELAEKDGKLRNLESRMESQRPLLVDQLNYVSKIHDQICGIIKVVDDEDHSDISESLFLPQETDVEENIRATLAGLESISELGRMAFEKTRDLAAERSREVKSLNETVSQLVREKEHVGSLLRSALTRRMSSDLTSKTNELFKVAENGLKEAGIDYRFSNHIGDGKVASDSSNNLETDDDEIYTLAGALENIIKQSQLEIIELQHTVEELRAETSLLKDHLEAQAKELAQKKKRVEELEEKERVANENIEGLMMDIAATEEEITRWKVAAQQEAAAGKSVEQEFVAQLSAVREELEEAKLAVIESEKKLKFKEQTAAAAMAARDAAEKSLRLADLRASRLRDRVEELTHQLEGLDTQDTSNILNRPRYVCWPWQWLGLNFIGSQRQDTQLQISNEMELSEPLI